MASSCFLKSLLVTLPPLGPCGQISTSWTSPASHAHRKLTSLDWKGEDMGRQAEMPRKDPSDSNFSSYSQSVLQSHFLKWSRAAPSARSCESPQPRGREVPSAHVLGRFICTFQLAV